ncbi:sortase [Cryobacterium psychrophilum]|uniref:Sortase n=1 Tax=Cryobacterium psychrophilum TaxID=41988 RepID=A0A4Y8KQC2_9MICO|nr:sortase [Cryobacterium psychrophilum]TDW30572.1 hypothetical protein EDD25_2336 [Cryobacterium psychrophilum]TFD80211.1 sortase [Cryobacterium psychrophilum]
MGKKTFAAIALAVLAVFAVPAAANAAGYVPASDVSVSGSATASSTVTVDVEEGPFLLGEEVNLSVDGAGTAVRSTFKAATVSLVKTASATGAATVNVTLPTDATGTYAVTATGLTSGNVATAAITVVAADVGAAANAAGDLASTGYPTPVAAIWAAAGALLLGVALVAVLTLLRRQRATAY